MKKPKFRNETEQFMTQFMSFNPEEKKQRNSEDTDLSIMFEKLISEFYSTKNMELKTDIKEKQLIPLTLCSMYAIKYDLPFFTELIQYLLKISVSLGRKGRIEWADIFKFFNEKGMVENGRFNDFRGLMGGLM